MIMLRDLDHQAAQLLAHGGEIGKDLLGLVDRALQAIAARHAAPLDLGGLVPA